MPITSPREMFNYELVDLYDAEHRFLEAMAKMRKLASDETLRTMLDEHIQQTEQQIYRLDEVFAEAGHKPLRRECMGARGLVDEASKTMGEAATNELRDAIIAGVATKAEHYELVSYMDLIDAAELLKLHKSVRLLTENREQEVSMARRLERLAPRLGKAAA